MGKNGIKEKEVTMRKNKLAKEKEGTMELEATNKNGDAVNLKSSMRVDQVVKSSRW